MTLEFAYDGLSRRVQKKTIKNGAAERVPLIDVPEDQIDLSLRNRLLKCDTGEHF